MFQFDPALKVYLHREAVDFRKSINGLAALVEHALALDPFGAALYVFRNRRSDRVKILDWERNGLWLLMKRLEACERYPNPPLHGDALFSDMINASRQKAQEPGQGQAAVFCGLA